MCDKKEFSNKNIKYNITGYENSLSDITFIYDVICFISLYSNIKNIIMANVATTIYTVPL